MLIRECAHSALIRSVGVDQRHEPQWSTHTGLQDLVGRVLTYDPNHRIPASDAWRLARKLATASTPGSVDVTGSAAALSPPLHQPVS